MEKSKNKIKKYPYYTLTTDKDGAIQLYAASIVHSMILDILLAGNQYEAIAKSILKEVQSDDI